MDQQQKEKLIKIHVEIVIARWIWIFIGSFRGEIMKWLKTRAASPISSVAEIGGFSVMLYLGIFQILFNIGLTIYLKFFKKKITDRGIKILNFIQVYVDLVAFTGFFYYGGGMEGPGENMLFIPLIISLVLYSQLGISLVAISGIAIYSLVVLGEYYNIIPKEHAYTITGSHLSENLFIVLYRITSFAMSYIGAAIFGSLASKTIKISEKEVLFEKDKTTSMISNLVDGVIMISGDNIISSINNRAKEYLSISDDVEGKNIKTDFEKFPTNLQKVFRMPSNRERKDLVVEKPNKLVLELSTIPVYNMQNKVFGSMKIIHDITREKEVDRLKTEFISVASHQLRTPLSAIKWTLQMLIEGDMGTLNEEQKKFLSKGYDSNEQMIRLVNDLLNVSRIEEGRFLFKLEKVNLQTVIEKIIRSEAILIEQAKEKGVEFKYAPPEQAVPSSSIDAEKLQIAITNLLENAINYTQKGYVKISLWYDDKERQNVISVEDTGVGVPEKEKDRLFAKFFRATNVRKMQTFYY